ncbi:MAG TPA: hydroxymethylbilane synthase [Methanocellaceae archaeon]|jgi:hydroxymethylbilane synthase
MKIGTRGSRLALAQAEKVCCLLKENGVEASPFIIKTSGDIHTSEPLHAMKGGVGAFVQEIDERLLNGEVDLAVHSLKDVPTARPAGIVQAAVLKRESACDVAITRNGERLSELKEGSTVGTSSTRRAALVKRHYPGLVTRNIRGNVDTRIRKLHDGEYDAILLAEAGLIRLGLDVGAERLDPYEFVPSANQGVITIAAIQDTKASDVAALLNDEATFIETRVERIIAAALDGGCVAPMGAYARIVDGGIDVVSEVLSLDGKERVGVRETIPLDGYEESAAGLARILADRGGRSLVGAAKRQLRGVPDGE